MTAIPDKAFTEGVAVLGRTGSGKTFAAKGQIEKLLQRGERVCIIDPTGVWYGLRSGADGKSDGFPVVVFGGDHADVPISENSGEALATLVAERNLPCVIDISELKRSEQNRFMRHFLDAVYVRNRQPLNMVFDEADLYCPQRPMPDQTHLLNRMEQIVRRGRVRGFRPWLITQRPAELHKSVLSQVGTLVAMKLPAPQDRKAIGDWIDGQADRAAGKQLLATLPKLGTGEGFVWYPAADFLERVKFPPITTFDTSRTPEHGNQVAAPQRLADVDLTGVLEALKPAQSPVERASQAVSDPDLQALAEAFQRGLAEGRLAAQAAILEVLDPVLYSLQNQVAQVTAARQRMLELLNGSLPAKIPEQYDLSGHLHVGATEEGETRPPEPPPYGTSPGAPVTKPQQRILDALAGLQRLGLHAPQRLIVALYAGVSPNSSGFDNNMGSMRSQGLIEYPERNHVRLSDAGRKAANFGLPPKTLSDLHEVWYGFIPKPAAAVLRALVAVYPKAMDREALAKRVGVSPRSSGFDNNLGRLRTLGAIEYPERGTARASELLFPRALMQRARGGQA